MSRLHQGNWIGVLAECTSETIRLCYVNLGVRMEAPRTAAELGRDRCGDGVGG